MKKELATKAANWWFDQIDKPHKNGEKSTEPMLALYDIMLSRKNKEINNNQKEIFIKTLSSDIINYSENNFGCDYSPEKIFHNALKKSNIDARRLPFKTFMSIDNDKNSIKVKEGYGTSWYEI